MGAETGVLLVPLPMISNNGCASTGPIGGWLHDSMPGFEPAASFDATADGDCSCDFCQGWREPNALQNGGSSCHVLASANFDLQRVVNAWDGLPTAMRRAVLALVGTDRQAGEA